MQNLTKREIIDLSFIAGRCGDLYVYSDQIAEKQGAGDIHPQLAESNANPEGWGWPEFWVATTYDEPILPFRLIHQYKPRPHNYMYGVVPAIYEVHLRNRWFWVFTME